MIPGVIPEIRWGAGYVAQWRPADPLDELVHFERPRAGTVRESTLSGLEVAWCPGMDSCVRGVVRWLSRAAWWADAGWRGLVAWAAEGHALRLYPSPDAHPDWSVLAYLDTVDAVEPELEEDVTTRVAIVLRGAEGASLAPVWVAVSPLTADGAGVTFSRASTARYAEQG